MGELPTYVKRCAARASRPDNGKPPPDVRASESLNPPYEVRCSAGLRALLAAGEPATAPTS
jgi:hypothetical protein